MGVIIANVGVMACDYWGIENDESNHLFYTQALFVFGNIYYCEATLKLIGLGPSGYFGDGWCRFDFFLVTTSLLDQFASELLASVLPIPPMVLRVLRVLRILRILRLLKGPGAKEIRDLIMTMVLSFPPLINVGSVLLLIVFMFAVLGVNLFTYVVPQENITDQRNFITLGNAMLLLFQCLTGDNWSGLMADALVSDESGLCSNELGNCGLSAAIPYFIAFQLLGGFVFLNLVVAVILENFSSLGNLNPELVSAADLENFKEAWSAYDPDGDSKIPINCLPDVIMSVPPPMGLQGVGKRKDALRLCMRLHCRNTKTFQMEPLRQEGGEVYFADVCDALVHRSYRSKEVSIDDAAAEVDDIVAEAKEGTLSALSVDIPNLAKSSSTYELGDDFAFRMEHDIDKIFALEIINLHRDKLMRWASRATARLTDRRAQGKRKAYEGVSANMSATDAFRQLRMEEARQMRVAAAALANGCGSAFHAPTVRTGAAPTPNSARLPKSPGIVNVPPGPASARGSVGASNASNKGWAAGAAAAAMSGGKALTNRAASFGFGSSKPKLSGASSRAQIAPAPLPPPGAIQQQRRRLPPPAPVMMQGGFGANAVACSERRRTATGTPPPPPPISVPSSLRGTGSSYGRSPAGVVVSARGALQSPGVSSTTPEAVAAAAELRAEFRAMRHRVAASRGGGGGSTPGTPGMTASARSPLCGGSNPSGRCTSMSHHGTPNGSARGGADAGALPSPPLPPLSSTASAGALEQFRALRSARAEQQVAPRSEQD